MKKYCFFMTGNSFWFEVAKSLKDNNIAEPVLWLGDDVHYFKALSEFDGEVLRMLDFVHRPYFLSNVDYSGKHFDFFLSENYARAKDICIKMMDRLDLYGSFSRIDRETYFHKLCIWGLSKIEDLNPDALVMVERPHSHAQYILYEICKFIGIETVYFIAWTNLPMACLYNETSENFVHRQGQFPSNYRDEFREKIHAFVAELSMRANHANAYEPVYMQLQRRDSEWWSRIKSFFGKTLKIIYLDIRHNLGVRIRGYYNPINPYRFGVVQRLLIQRNRSINLLKNCSTAAEKMEWNKPYVYFPLHFEPERTTNPDGRRFHDHFAALVALRGMLPKEINIVVKEHPSQFYYSEKGARGRSPLFYDLIKSIRGVKFIGVEYNSIELISRSIFTATITGTVAIESALMGKVGLYFGETWYEGCPNTIRWNEDLDYRYIDKFNIRDCSSIETYFKSKLDLYSIPLFHNPSALKIYPEYVCDSFIAEQTIQVSGLLENYFSDLASRSARVS